MAVRDSTTGRWRSSRAQLTAALAVALVAVLAGCASSSSYLPKLSGPTPWSCQRPNAKHMLVAELYMGRSMPNGAYVSEFAWQQFLADVVTPRFPDGLTSLDAYGQYRNRATRIITRENSKVLIIAAEDSDETETKLGQITEAYKQRFQQESVMLVERIECVDFL
jgi:hypothetical protein